MNAENKAWRRQLSFSGPVELSLIIPVYNELAVLPLLHERLRAVLEPLQRDFEILFVDDGSSDGSGEYLAELAKNSKGLKVIRLSRNFGKEAALSAGLEQCRGDVVIVIDADLQDPPELIPDMLEAYQQGSDIVCMRRCSRAGEGPLKRWSAHVFYRLLNRLSRVEIPEDTGDFRLMSRRAVDALLQLPERNRYMKGLFAWVGFPTRVMLYHRDARAAGSSKWPFLKLLGLAFEGITSFSIAPLRWATILGLFAAVVGAGFGLWIVLSTLLMGNHVAGYPSIIAMMTFMGGVQLTSIGLVGEYVGKTYSEAKQRPLYIVQDVIAYPENSRRSLTLVEQS